MLGIKETAGINLEVADNWRRVARSESEGERRDGVESFENVSLAGDDGTAERGIEIMLLQQAPGDELLRLVLTGFPPEALRDAIFDFVGIGASGVSIEADKLQEIIDAGDIAIGNVGLDGVFIAPARVGLLERHPREVALQSGKSEIYSEFAIIACDGTIAEKGSGRDFSARHQRVTVVGGAKDSSGGGVEP